MNQDYWLFIVVVQTLHSVFGMFVYLQGICLYLRNTWFCSLSGNPSSSYSAVQTSRTLCLMADLASLFAKRFGVKTLTSNQSVLSFQLSLMTVRGTKTWHLTCPIPASAWIEIGIWFLVKTLCTAGRSCSSTGSVHMQTTWHKWNSLDYLFSHLALSGWVSKDWCVQYVVLCVFLDTVQLFSKLKRLCFIKD